MNVVTTIDQSRYRGSVATPSIDDASPVIALIGMMGSGKTTVGALLATRTGSRLVDLDAVIEADAGRSIATIFAEEGEGGFRDRELTALEAALATAGASVVATGGGVVTTDAARVALRAGATIVWLDVPVDDLAARLGDGVGRPMLGRDPVGALQRLDAERRGLYEEIADVVVDGRGSPDEVADRVLAGLEVRV